MKRVVITGAAGNLGWKLVRHLCADGHVSRVVGLDLNPPTEQQLAELSAAGHGDRFKAVCCDLADGDDRRWRNEIEHCDAVVHFAAKNPFPEATWDDANTSLDMTINVALAAAEAGVRRFVFVSSNHVMGRSKDEPLASRIGPGELTTDLPHAVGTVWHTGDRLMDSTVYAVAKSSGERVCRALATQGSDRTTSSGRTTFVCVRVGWCQPGDNLPATLSAAGTPTQTTGSVTDAGTDADAAQFDATEQWFRSMWLSNRDFAHLFERAVMADGAAWPHPCIVVNGMSANTGMKWSLSEATELLGYQPRDNVAAGG